MGFSVFLLVFPRVSQLLQLKLLDSKTNSFDLGFTVYNLFRTVYRKIKTQMHVQISSYKLTPVHIDGIKLSFHMRRNPIFTAFNLNFLF